MSTAEARDELAALAARGVLSTEQYEAVARQILANGVKEGGTAKLPLVATNADRLFGNLGKQWGASADEMEFRYVMANNAGLDPNDSDAYTAARDNLRAKIAKGGVTINMPTGVGEYTGQTDRQFGYDTIRAERAAAAQMQQQALMAGYGANPTFFGLMEANMVNLQKHPELVAERRAHEAAVLQARNAYINEQWGQLGMNVVGATAAVMVVGGMGLATGASGGLAAPVTVPTMVAGAGAFGIAGGNAIGNLVNLRNAYSGGNRHMPTFGQSVDQIAGTSIAAGLDALGGAMVGGPTAAIGKPVAGVAGSLLGSSANINGLISGATNLYSNMVFNRSANVANNVTAFGSGYAAGVAGSLVGGAPIGVGTKLFTGGVIGLSADYGAQIIEKYSDPTYGPSNPWAFQPIRAVGNTINSLAGVGLSHKFKPYAMEAQLNFGQVNVPYNTSRVYDMYGWTMGGVGNLLFGAGQYGWDQRNQ